MTVKDFMEYSVDGDFTFIELCDINDNFYPIYKGLYMDMPYKYDSYEIESFDMYEEEDFYNDSKCFISLNVK